LGCGLVGPRNRVLDSGARLRHLANTTEWSVRVGDAVLFCITMTTCYQNNVSLSQSQCSCVWSTERVVERMIINVGVTLDRTLPYRDHLSETAANSQQPNFEARRFSWFFVGSQGEHYLSQRWHFVCLSLNTAARCESKTMKSLICCILLLFKTYL